MIEKGNKYTKDGYRVLAVTSSNNDFMTFIGFILIKDEIREESIEGIKLVKSAGIQTVMITGDNVLTARTIAKEVGLIENDNDLVLTSE